MKIKTIQMALMALALMLVQFVFVSDSQAQRMRMGRGGGMMVGVLAIEEVQKELKLDDETVKKVTELAEEMQSEMSAAMREAFQDAGDDRAAMQEEIAEIQKEFAEKEKKPIGELLDDKQMKRLKELVVQQQGPAILAKKEFATSIGLSDEECKKLKDKFTDLQAEMRESMMELFQGGDREAMQKAMKEGRENMNKEMMAMLTDDQRKKFEAAKGAKFEFPEVQRRGGRRGGGRPRNDF